MSIQFRNLEKQSVHVFPVALTCVGVSPDEDVVASKASVCLDPLLPAFGMVSF